MAAVKFNDGKRYTDFDSSTDKVAAYGLAALVAGVAAKKLGLLAIAGAFFAQVREGDRARRGCAIGGGLWSTDPPHEGFRNAACEDPAAAPRAG